MTTIAADPKHLGARIGIKAVFHTWGSAMKLPDVLSVDEVARLLEAAPGIKYRAALGVAYGAGLRVEVAHLKADDIDSRRMLIRIEEGIVQRPRPAVSCLEGNRTPLGARFPSHIQTFTPKLTFPQSSRPCSLRLWLELT